MAGEPSEGDLVRDLIEGATEKVLLAAPFIKAPALRRCLEKLQPGVLVEVFTRWRPEEIVAGVSDLAVWNEIKSLPRAHLYLSHRLHAKVYRNESRCLVGSANLTGSALGWVSPPNLELLVESRLAEPRIAHFEQSLRRSAVEVDDELHAQVVALVSEYEASAPEYLAAEESSQWGTSPEETPIDLEATVWLPLLRQPQDLYLAYSPVASDLSSQSRLAALRDLAALSLPTGLNEKAFNEAVAIALLQMPAVSMIDSVVASPQRFGAVVSAIEETLSLTRTESTFAWQTLMRWLLYFVPGRYERRVNRHTEMFSRRS